MLVEHLMRKTISVLVIVITSLTGLSHSKAAQSISSQPPQNATWDEMVEWTKARNEPNQELNYREFAEGIRKLNLTEKVDLTLPKVKYPYFAWFEAHQDDFQKYASIGSWVSGKTLRKLDCAESANPETTTNVTSARAESVNPPLRSTFRNFDLMSVVAMVPGYANCGLTESEYAAIFDYTAEIYQTLNPALRSGTLSDDQKEFAATLARALDKIGKYKGWVKRGDNLSALRKARYVVGAVIEDAGFMSTSLTGGFIGISQFQIYSQTGRYIAPLSHSHGEEEVTFKPHTKFKVVNVQVDEVDPSVTNYKMIEVVD